MTLKLAPRPVNPPGSRVPPRDELIGDDESPLRLTAQAQGFRDGIAGRDRSDAVATLLLEPYLRGLARARGRIGVVAAARDYDSRTLAIEAF